MAYDIKAKFKKNSPLPCWKGYERVPGTKKVLKVVVVKLHLQKKQALKVVLLKKYAYLKPKFLA